MELRVQKLERRLRAYASEILENMLLEKLREEFGFYNVELLHNVIHVHMSTNSITDFFNNNKEIIYDDTKKYYYKVVPYDELNVNDIVLFVEMNIGNKEKMKFFDQAVDYSTLKEYIDYLKRLLNYV